VPPLLQVPPTLHSATEAGAAHVGPEQGLTLAPESQPPVLPAAVPVQAPTLPLHPVSLVHFFSILNGETVECRVFKV